jgi:[citrate (pro-3S)-lyase] ligase
MYAGIVFVLSAEQPMFPASVRLALVQRGCEAMKNVTVVSGGDYLISRETFPGYFLKDIGTADMAYAALELHLFAGRIAPALGIRRRFVGEEPFCPVTAAYNAAMRDILPRAGIAVTVLPRWRNISAGEVRRLLEQGRVEETKEMLPEVTYEYCADHFGAGTACP